MNDLQGEKETEEATLARIADETSSSLETQVVQQDEVIFVGDIAINLNGEGRVGR